MVLVLRVQVAESPVVVDECVILSLWKIEHVTLVVS